MGNKAPEKKDDQEVAFTTVSFSEKQIVDSFVGKNDKEYNRILAPNGMTFLFPSDKVHDDQFHKGRKTISLPTGSEIELTKSTKMEGMENQFSTIETKMKVEDIKNLYDSNRKEFKEAKQAEREANNNRFLRIEFPEKLIKMVQGKGENEGKNYARVTLPLQENNTTKYYSFLVNEKAVRNSENPGKKMVGLLKEKDDGSDYMLRMTCSEKQKDGTYKETKKEMSSKEIKSTMEESAKKYKEEKQSQQQQKNSKSNSRKGR